MFQLFAGNKKVIIIIAGLAVLAFLALVYFEWGKGGTSSPNELARINGRSIYLQDIKPLYEQIKERYKDQISKENAQQVEKQIMFEALKVLIQKYIILDQAQKAKVGVSSDEILRTISRNPNLQTKDGKFNDRYYQSLPAFYKQKLEKETQEELITQLFQIRLFDLIKISDIDLRLFFMEKNTKSKIRFVFVEGTAQNQTQGDNLLSVNDDRMKAEKKIQQFMKIIKKTGNFTGTAASLGLAVRTTDYFGFFQPITRPGSQDRFNEIEFQDIYLKAFSLKPYQISDQINLNKGFAVIQVLSKSSPNWDKFYKELPMLRAEYEAKLRQYVLQDWYMKAVTDSKIKNNLDKLFQQNTENN